MRFGLFVPPLGPLAHPARLADLAAEAEAAGWEGFFVWDHVLAGVDKAVADPWVALAAVACATRRLRLGPMVTPLARRRPWVVARQTITLDHLSRGRLVMGVGLGDDGWGELSAFGGEVVDGRVRGEVLDEALEVLCRFWDARPVSFQGRHIRVESPAFKPGPVQSPRIPIWLAELWPHRAPLRRAARFDGVFAISAGHPLGGAEVAHILDIVHRHRAVECPIEIIVQGRCRPKGSSTTPADLAELEAAGATWWLETLDESDSVNATLAVVRAGPPVVS